MWPTNRAGEPAACPDHATLAGEGHSIAVESPLSRLLRAADQLTHRGRARAPDTRSIPCYRAQGVPAL